MKVLLQSRVDLFDKRGGDTVHLEKSKKALEQLGVSVSVSLESNKDLSDYDLVHLFNLDWVRDTYLQCLNAKKQKKKVVLTPIHHRFSEIEQFEMKARFGLRRLLNPIFRSFETREKFKNIYRAIFDKKKRNGTLIQLRRGIRSQQLEVLKMVDLVLPNTTLEDEEVRKEYQLPIKSMVVPAGVDALFAEARPDWFHNNYKYLSHSMLGDFILSVGRIEPRKNQLNIIKAIRDTQIPILFIGEFNKFHPEYCFRVKREMKNLSHVFHIPTIDHRNIASIYAACRVHVLASWFETTGLVNLEAALAGANIVSTCNGYGREYLGNHAWYVNPQSQESIKNGIIEAFNAPRKAELKKQILKNYTWEIVGEKTFKSYQEVVTN